MSTDWEQQKRATVAAFGNPQLGDRFHDMWSFWVYVVDLGTHSVTTYEAGGHPSRMPDCGGKLRTFQTRGDFREAYQYGRGNTGYWVTLADRGNDVTGWVSRVLAKADSSADQGSGVV